MSQIVTETRLFTITLRLWRVRATGLRCSCAIRTRRTRAQSPRTADS
jgi:hypothetical protein